MFDTMRDLKRFTSGRIARQARVEGKVEWLEAFEIAGTESGRADVKVWQDGNWEQILVSEEFIREKLNYIHRNQVRAGLVASPRDYPYSSCRNYELCDESLIEMDKDWL